MRYFIGTLPLLSVGTLVAFLSCDRADATVVNVVPKSPYTAMVGACTAGAKKFKDCVSTAIISTDTATADSTFLGGNYNGTAPTNQTFMSTFTNWNNNQKTGVTWDIVNDAPLEGLTLTVDPFEASATAGAGGIGDITIIPTIGRDYNGPPLSQLAWTQAVYANFSPSGGGPANTLDTYSFTHGGNLAGCSAIPAPPKNSNNVTVDIPGINPIAGQYCDPLYFFLPNNPDNKRLVDAPTGSWPDASFRAIALLSTVAETTDASGKVTSATLTVYDGVSYGFDLTATQVPLPPTLLLAVPGFALLLAKGFRRQPA
jgi:hypothetical protein